ncbi:type IV conjugative transfer system lipoprotein TraV [Rhodoferax sp.]|uniref:type IV conjugative transfer system lipoprotein TraV n=1 Tax=Rhodoferax sp. TaxID=50421 RepID=UPI00271AC645|nr:type IV conjugative transfer system lipoprotein TraV [Rhodoferax sp.]MDO9198357.1 type IV conjugative transfer system lipoprotein TraV [Rhodoferax sp.]
MNTRFQLLRGDAGLRAIALAGMLALSGCSNLSGVGGGSKYACKAPEGVACDSVSGTYANALHNKLPSQRQQQPAETSTPTPAPSQSPSTAPRRTPMTAAPAVATTGTLTPTLGTSPLRSQSRVLRLWTKPWEDADGDLYDQGYVYVQVSTGQWLIDHVQHQIRDAYAPLRPPSKSNADVSSDLGQSSGSTAGSSFSSRSTPTETPSPSFGTPSVGMPSGTSFNRTQ